MAIFTPNQKFMKLMKTTINTNKYFIENKKEENIMPNIDIISEEYNDDDNIVTGNLYYNDNNTIIANNITDKFDELNDKCNKYDLFLEQQIKLNKQTKNNFDRLNKKITVNFENINEKMSNNNDNIIKYLNNIESTNCLFTDEIKKLKYSIRWLICIQVFFIMYYIITNLLN